MKDDDFLRFMRSVIKTESCWIWNGTRQHTGYGQFKISGKTFRAHRVSYEHFTGRIPDKLLVRHTCDTPLCVNPAHLVLGTDLDNMTDKVERGRVPRGTSHYLSKLTDAQIEEIRQLYVSGDKQFSQPALARKYGVNHTTLR
jgi:hypothetical protein